MAIERSGYIEKSRRSSTANDENDSHGKVSEELD